MWRSGRRGKMGRPPWKHLGLGSGRGRGNRAPASPLSGAVAILPAEQPSTVGPVASRAPTPSALPAGIDVHTAAFAAAPAPLPAPQPHSAAEAQPSRIMPAFVADSAVLDLASLTLPPPSLQQRIPAESLAPSLRKPVPAASAPPPGAQGLASTAGRQQQGHTLAHESSLPSAQPGQAPQQASGPAHQGSAPKSFLGKALNLFVLHTSTAIFLLLHASVTFLVSSHGVFVSLCNVLYRGAQYRGVLIGY